MDTNKCPKPDLHIIHYALESIITITTDSETINLFSPSDVSMRW